MWPSRTLIHKNQQREMSLSGGNFGGIVAY